jgi:hypothetical protein
MSHMTKGSALNILRNGGDAELVKRATQVLQGDSLASKVVAAVTERGSANADVLAPVLIGYTRAQILAALNNARHEGWLTCKQGRGLGSGRGKTPGTFYPIDGERVAPPRRLRRRVNDGKVKYVKRPQFASVFHYAQNISVNDESTNRRTA